MNFPKWIAIICNLALLVSVLTPAIHDFSHQHTLNSHDAEHAKTCDAHKETEAPQDGINILDLTGHEACSICNMIQQREPISIDSLSTKYLPDLSLEKVKVFFNLQINRVQTIDYYDARAGPQIA